MNYSKEEGLSNAGYSVTRIPIPFSVDLLPSPAYLVGGAVRDWILQRDRTPAATAKLDLDFVFQEGSIQHASQLAKTLGGGFVVLDAEREIARIVLKSATRDITLDIAKQIGPTLHTDLQARDFTCNAIALELHTDTWIDPLNGFQDITSRQIRMIHPDNLSADPLRLLRAYRQAAQLGFELDPTTRTAIQHRVDLLTQVAAERVRTEIHYLIQAGPTGLTWLEEAWRDHLLRDWLPHLSMTCFQAARHLHTLIPSLQAGYPYTFQRLKDPITDQRTLTSLVTLAVLLQDFPHLETTLETLKYSRAERQILQKLHTLLPPFLTILSGSLGSADYYTFFQDAGSLFPALALLALTVGTPPETLHSWLTHYEDPADRLAHPLPLVDGQQLLQALGLKPGPHIGQLLKAIGLAQATGHVTTLEEALSYAQHLTSSSPSSLNH